MAIITTMTTPASSLRAALQQGPEAFGFDLSGSNPALCALGSTKRFALNSEESQAIGYGFPAFAEAHATRNGTRRPRPSRFFPLSHSEQVS